MALAHGDDTLEMQQPSAAQRRVAAKWPAGSSNLGMEFEDRENQVRDFVWGGWQ